MDYSSKKEIPGRCLECGEPLLYGRKDKKFCNDDCRNSWHNRNAHKVRATHGRVATALNRNYEILDALVRKKVECSDLDELKAFGFRDNYFTGFRPGRYCREYQCFEICYKVRGQKVYDLHRLLPPPLPTNK